MEATVGSIREGAAVMTFIKILALIGTILMGIPILCGICYVLWEFAQCWRKMTWDERLNFMFQTGFIISISAAAGWIILASHEKPITADASTDTQQEIPPQVENCNQEELPQ